MKQWNLKSSFLFEGREIRYDSTGRGPAVILVHGTPWSSFNWRHVISNLSNDFKVFYYDLLGYGQSEKAPGQDVSLGIQNRVLSSLIKHWGVENPIVIGHDFGGATVLRAHLLDHQQYRHLILCNPVAISPWGSPFFQHIRKFEAAFEGVPDYIHDAIVNAYINDATHHPMTEETRKGICLAWQGDSGQAAFYRQMAQADRCYTDEVEDQYHLIECPTLILWGAQDSWIPIEKGVELQSRIKGSKLVPIANASHLVQEDQPLELVKHIRQFLNEKQS